MKRLLLAALTCAACMAVLPGFAQSVIQGQLLYHDLWPIHPAKVLLVRTTNQTIADSTQTDTLGQYAFSQVAAGSYIIKVTPQFTYDDIDMADALLVIHYLAPGQQINLSLLQRLAADMNKDSQISIGDALAIIQKWIANQLNKTTTEEEWIFVADTSLPDTLVISGQITDTTNYNLNGAPEADTQGAPPRPQKKPSYPHYLKAGAVLTASAATETLIPVRMAESVRIGGMGLVLGLSSPDACFLGFEPVLPGWTIQVSGNFLRLAWVDETAGGRTFLPGELLGHIRLQLSPSCTHLSITQGPASHVISAEGTQLKQTLFEIPSVQTETHTTRLEAVYPHPVTGSAQIQYALATASEVKLRLLDLQGRMVQEILHATKEAGSHTQPFTSHQLRPGIYVLEMTVQETQQRFRLTRQVLLAD